MTLALNIYKPSILLGMVYYIFMAILDNNRYIKTEALSGIILLVAAITGFVLSNSPFRLYYEGLINFPLHLQIGQFKYVKPLLFWINDGLVSIFFFLIGLEIKSVLFSNDAPIREQLALPFSAAICGVILPALIYTAFNHADPTNMRGWAIPTAIDTAFVLGVIALIGPSIPTSLKMFIMSLSIIDDILAVLIIAIFYAEELSNLAIVGSASIMGILVLINQARITTGWIYILLGFILWLFVLGSGVHTSVAGVLLALAIPMHPTNKNKNLLDIMKKKLHPWVSFLILPLFAFANTDVPLEDINLEQFFYPLSLGIIFGLFIGKQLGIFGITYLLVNHSSAKLPEGANWRQMYGVSVLCGIGFTMSLFIGLLAFESGGPEYDHLVKASVFIGSLLSAMFGYTVLKICK